VTVVIRTDGFAPDLNRKRQESKELLMRDFKKDDDDDILGHLVTGPTRQRREI
jgi:hypothetical protein